MKKERSRMRVTIEAIKTGDIVDLSLLEVIIPFSLGLR
jgi:hypothetical protein